MADPEPDNVRTVFDSYSSVVDANPNGAHPANLLEVKEWMLSIGLEQLVVSVGDSLNSLR